jgi:tRNA-dihydrouridine synthase A
MLRPALGLYAGLPGARSWRRYLSEEGPRPGATAEVLRRSLRIFRQAA